MKSIARTPLQRIIIVGDGIVGISAAIAIRQALPMAQIRLLGGNAHPAAFADRSPTALPFANRFHESLDLDEVELVRRTGASHRLVTAWSDRHGTSRTGAYGENAEDPENHIATLAQEMRFEPAFPLSADDYALRWHPGAYRALLVERAQRIGVGYQNTLISGVSPDGFGGISAINLIGADAVSADLYLDASSPDATLMAALDGHGRIDWADELGIDRVAYAAPSEATLSLQDNISWTKSGLLSQINGRDAVSRMLLAYTGADDIEIGVALGGIPTDIVALAPGRASAAWIGNVIAIGDAAATFPPISGAPLDLAQRQIALLVDLLPGLPIIDAERAEYNRRAAQMADSARDWISTTILAFSAANSEPLSPAGQMLDQFRRRGAIPFVEDAPLATAEWRAQLRAQGLGPARHSPKLNASIAASPWAEVPPYRVWLASALSGTS
jgi:tryptophan 7-halogenase